MYITHQILIVKVSLMILVIPEPDSPGTIMSGSYVIRTFGHYQIFSVKVFTMIGAIHYSDGDEDGWSVVDKKNPPTFVRG